MSVPLIVPPCINASELEAVLNSVRNPSDDSAVANILNAAAIREALEQIKKVLIGIRDYSSDYEASQSADKLLNEYIIPSLAKPCRNCDRFGGDYKMLHSMWFDWTGSPSGQNPDGTVKMSFPEYLLAPATTKGGEA